MKTSFVSKAKGEELTQGPFFNKKCLFHLKETSKNNNFDLSLRMKVILQELAPFPKKGVAGRHRA
jgi:hypothetical protein